MTRAADERPPEGAGHVSGADPGDAFDDDPDDLEDADEDLDDEEGGDLDDEEGEGPDAAEGEDLDDAEGEDLDDDEDEEYDDEDGGLDEETSPGEVIVESDEAFAEATHAVRPRPHRLAGALTLTTLAVLAFSTGLLLFNNLVMPRLIHGVGEVRVPDLENLTVEQAEKHLTPLGLQLSRAGERFDPSVPTGFIIAQDPPPDTPVRGKKRVSVIVSLGEEFSSVPELFGESLRGARLLIERAGLKVGNMTRAPSDEVGEGLIVASDPPAESVLPRDMPVGLLVSSGAGPEYFVMPDVLGREIGGVRRQLEALGFRVFTPPAAASIGTIVFQNPAAGSRITRDESILLQATGRVIR